MERWILACYEDLGIASAQMLRFALDDDLDNLVDAEKRVTALVAQLSTMGDSSTLSPQGAQRKMAIIRNLLSDDAKIRAVTQPWLRRLENLLMGSAASSRLDKAYET